MRIESNWEVGAEKVVGCESIVNMSSHSNLRHLLPKMNVLIRSNVEFLKLLKYHQATHPGRTQYVCPVCQKSFCLKTTLTKHLRTHVKFGPSPCPKSENIFSIKNCVRHLTRYLGDEFLQHTKCEKSLSTRRRLISHKANHASHRCFQCTEYEQRVVRKKNVNRLQKTHTDAGSFQCTECEKSFNQKGLLRRHQRVHSEENSYHCNECGKSYAWKQDLRRHQRTHTGKSALTKGERRHQCGRSISTQSPCNDQLGESKTLCSDCAKTLSQINVHIKRHRGCKGKKPYRCIECENIFAQNTHHITQERKKHTAEGIGKTHMIIARLLEVSAPNEYFILQQEEDTNIEILEDAIREKLSIKWILKWLFVCSVRLCTWREVWLVQQAHLHSDGPVFSSFRDCHQSQLQRSNTSWVRSAYLLIPTQSIVFPPSLVVLIAIGAHVCLSSNPSPTSWPHVAKIRLLSLPHGRAPWERNATASAAKTRHSNLINNG